MSTAPQWSPRPGWLLVTRAVTEEKLGSLVLTPEGQRRYAGWTYDVVRSGGALEVEDEDPGTPHDFQPGDWVLTPPRRTMDYDEEGVLLLAEIDVWAVLV